MPALLRRAHLPSCYDALVARDRRPLNLIFSIWAGQPKMLAARRVVGECVRRVSVARSLSGRAWGARAHVQRTLPAAGRPRLACSPRVPSRMFPFFFPVSSILSGRGYAGTHTTYTSNAHITVLYPIRPPQAQGSEVTSSVPHHGDWHDR